MKMTTKTKRTPKTADKAKTHKVGAAKKAIGAIKPSGQGKDKGEKLPQKQGEVGNKKPPAEHQFAPGQSGNPGGKPVGTRNRLQGDFLRELSEDFSEHGKAAIVACRTEQPAVYVRVIASLLPKEIEVKRPLEGLSEDELIAGVDALRSFLAAKSDGSGAKATPSGKPVTEVRTLQ